MSVTRCFRCDGKGKTRAKIDWLAGVFTLGITILDDVSNWNKCEACDGQGFLRDSNA